MACSSAPLVSRVRRPANQRAGWVIMGRLLLHASNYFEIKLCFFMIFEILLLIYKYWMGHFGWYKLWNGQFVSPHIEVLIFMSQHIESFLMSHYLEGSVTFNIVGVFRNSDWPSFASDSAAAQEFGNQSSQSFLKYRVISGQICSFPVWRVGSKGQVTYHGISEIWVVVIGKSFHQFNSFVWDGFLLGFGTSSLFETSWWTWVVLKSSQGGGVNSAFKLFAINSLF